MNRFDKARQKYKPEHIKLLFIAEAPPKLESERFFYYENVGEASTSEIAKKKDAQGFDKNKVAAIEGGSIAGNARKELENKSGTKVSTRNNYKEITELKHKSLKL
jgi:hypothetical protein